MLFIVKEPVTKIIFFRNLVLEIYISAHHLICNSHIVGIFTVPNPLAVTGLLNVPNVASNQMYSKISILDMTPCSVTDREERFGETLLSPSSTLKLDASLKCFSDRAS